MAASPLSRPGSGRRCEPRFDAFFLADRAAISPVRRKLRESLEADGLGHVADDVVLACSELMANAVVHGCRRFPPDTRLTVTASWDHKQVRISVHDPSNDEPRSLDPSSSRTDGRGLEIISQLATRWGVQPDTTGRGKAVWVELDLNTPDSAVDS